MKFISTRDQNKKELSYTDTLLAGLAPDRGLFVPLEYPQFSLAELQSIKCAPYTEIAFQVKRKIIGWDIPDEDLKTLVNQAYTQDKFPTTKDGNITPLRKVEENLYIQNLSAGPTAAFKDMAMQQLWQEMNHELNKRWETLTILGATSGDTGSAAEAAMKWLKSITLFMLSPQIGMSKFQKAQMANLSGWNIHNISIDGRFDDCQDMVKDIKSMPEFANLWAVNSINWGRISSQVPYYFSGYLQAVDTIGEEIDFCVPSGNFGNVLSWYIAKKMWLPIRRLIVATNENNVLEKVFKTWVYSVSAASITSSPSMDISKASNYERLAFDILGRDGEILAKYMTEFENKWVVDLSDYGVSPSDLEKLWFISGSSSHAARLDMIRYVRDKTGSVIDPHTADALKVAIDLRDKDIKTICLETALPVKFESTIQEALAEIPERPEQFQGLESVWWTDTFTNLWTNREELCAFMKKWKSRKKDFS